MSERGVTARAGRALDFEIISVIMVKFLQGFDQQIIDGKPDGAAPIRIAAEQPRLRLSLFITDDIGRSMTFQYIRVFLVILAHGTDAVVAQKLVRCEHSTQKTLHSVTAGQCDKTSFA